MVASEAFAELLREQFSALGPIGFRRMFGKTGVFCDGLMFGVVAENTLYFRVDDDNRKAFREAEAHPPLNYSKQGATIELSPRAAAADRGRLAGNRPGRNQIRQARQDDQAGQGKKAGESRQTNDVDQTGQDGQTSEEDPLTNTTAVATLSRSMIRFGNHGSCALHDVASAECSRWRSSGVALLSKARTAMQMR
jgi:TfoX/Sxy family transcriptional regulator of competence genes